MWVLSSVKKQGRLVRGLGKRGIKNLPSEQTGGEEDKHRGTQQTRRGKKTEAER